MKKIKCDRCGKIDDGPIYGMGITPYYIGNIRMYQYAEFPGFEGVDLCNKCQGKFDKFVDEFMETKK